MSTFGTSTRAKLAGPGDREAAIRSPIERWPADWSVEFTDLLTLLTRLVEAKPAQADLLDRVLAGPLLTMPTLTEHGVPWPASSADRKPDFTTPAAPETPSDRLF